MKIVLLLSLLVVGGCGTSQTSPATPSPQQKTTAAASAQTKPKLDACALLTSQEIQSVQGEALKETKLSESAADGFNVSQCFFSLPTFNNSISLSVTQRADGPGARDPRQFWRDTFHRDKDRGEKEDEESRPPIKVTGIGDEAFWMTSRAAGILYVLKGSSYIRISIGGGGDQQTRIKKSKTLAQKVIDRL